MDRVLRMDLSFGYNSFEFTDYVLETIEQHERDDIAFAMWLDEEMAFIVIQFFELRLQK